MVQKIHPRGVIGVLILAPTYVKRFQIRELLSECSILEPSLDNYYFSDEWWGIISKNNIIMLINLLILVYSVMYSYISGLAEHFQIIWGQADVVGLIWP